MEKGEFLKVLGNNLWLLSGEERDEVIRDYDDHFRFGILEGRTEEQIASALGSPKSIARQFVAERKIQQAGTTVRTPVVVRAVLAVAGLGFLPVILVLLPLMVITVVLLSLYAAAAGSVVGGAALIVGRLLMPVFPQAIQIGMGIIETLFAAISMSSAGLLLFLGLRHVTRWLVQTVIRFLKFTVQKLKA